MIARKIENAAKTLGNIKLHLEPAVWKTMCQAINIILEAAAEVRVLEKKNRMVNAPAVDGFIVPDTDGGMKINPSKLGDHLEGIAAVLRESGASVSRSGPGASVIQSNQSPDLTIVPALEVK